VCVLGARLYDLRTGVLAALAFALLPGISVSSALISTDVPLLLTWALALIAFSALFQTTSWWPALLLGVGLGLGLNAKYAMAWFILCGGLYLAATPARRGILKDGRLWVGLALGLACILPNLAWNQAHSFATFSHTADNAKWEGSLLNPGKALEFFGSQFGVFGPFYFAGLLVIVGRARTARLPEPDRLLLAFCLPLVAIITLQAFVSRAHPNWAAPAYISGVVLVVATLVRDVSWGWLRASYGLHAAILALFVFATTTAGVYVIPLIGDPMARTLGWRAIADATRAELDRARAVGKPYGCVLTDDRSIAAELLYYLKDQSTPVLAWRSGPRPHDHFELTRPFTKASAGPVLLVSLRQPIDIKNAPVTASRPKLITDAFETSEPVGQRMIPAGRSETRRVTFLALSGYKGS
jgi:4-amino-4-deoxy-L-arabinose transferase-like glycosyltransferase